MNRHFAPDHDRCACWCQPVLIVNMYEEIFNGREEKEEATEEESPRLVKEGVCLFDGSVSIAHISS